MCHGSVERTKHTPFIVISSEHTPLIVISSGARAGYCHFERSERK